MESGAVGFVTLLALRVTGLGYACAPARLRRVLAWSLGGALRRLGVRSAVVRQNLAIAFPGEGNRALRAKLFRQAYAHMGSVILEVLWLLAPFGFFKRYVRDRVTAIGVEHWREAHAQGRGVIYLSSHVGNWEVMAATGGREGHDLMLVTKRLKPAWLHRAIERARARCGVSATYEPRTLRDVLAHLKRNGTVGFVLDQYAGHPIGIRVPLFGVPVGTAGVLASVVRRTGAVVVPVVNHRQPDGRWVVHVKPPLPWLKYEDPNYELAANTANYVAALEADIRLHPGQWLWTHRRFKGDLTPLRPDEWRQGRARGEPLTPAARLS